MSKRDDIVNGKDNSTATVCSIKNKTHNKKEQKEYDQDVTVTVLNDHSLYDTQERKSNKKVDEIIATSYSNKNHIHTIYDNHDSVAKHCNSGYDHSQSYNHSHNCSAKHSHNSHNHQSLSSYDNHNHGGSKSYDTHNHGGSTSYGYGGSTSYDYGGSSSYDNGGSSSYDNY
ncbi:hypothetical protein K502DRAFT_326674 [Neoconidiobolus thromboides FSU 785]|nr:hypothetical protein K502DRAFT_326674 [Neoconidiobolus thromboides FSU 785]